MLQILKTLGKNIRIALIIEHYKKLNSLLKLDKYQEIRKKMVVALKKLPISWQNSLANSIALILAVIILITITTLTVLAIKVQKQEITEVMEAQLQDSTRMIIDKISILQTTLDSREFDKKLEYHLGVQRAEYLKRGNHLTQFIFNSDGTVRKQYGTLQSLPVNKDELQTIFQEKQGLIHTLSKYTLAYSYSFEQQALVVLVLADQEYFQPINELRNTMILIGIIALLLSYLAANFIIRSITRPISHIADTMSQVSAGNLNVSFTSDNGTKEVILLGESFRKMLNSLKKIFFQITGSVHSLNTVSINLKDNSEEVKRAVDDITNSLKQINLQAEKQMQAGKRSSIQVENLNSSVNEILEQNKLTVNTSWEIMQKSEVGRSSINQVIDDMNQLCQAAQNTQATIDNLQVYINRIKELNVATRQISKKTHMVALNATIEAARFNKSGRTFSVVAEEIEKLARESQKFSQHTEEIITNVLQNFKHMQIQFDRMYTKVLDCTATADKSGQIFAVISKDVINNNQFTEKVSQTANSIFNMVQDISNEINCVCEHAKSISHFIPEIIEYSSQTRLNTCRVFDKSLELSSLAEDLQHLVNTITNAKVSNYNDSDKSTVKEQTQLN